MVDVLRAQDVFAPGDRVRALLTGMAEGFMRISLSTAELETTPGDMLYNKVRAAAALSHSPLFSACKPLPG